VRFSAFAVAAFAIHYKHKNEYKNQQYETSKTTGQSF
jgi:hypothetical protein